MNPDRPLNQPDRSAKVREKRGSRGVSSADGAPWLTARSVSGGERSLEQTQWRRVPVSPVDGLGVFQTRTIFSVPRRPSSGYFSSDSMPGSPLSPRSLTTDRATQTPSPSGQAMQHALELMAQGLGGAAGAGAGAGAGGQAQQRHGGAVYRCSRRPQISAGEMHEEEIGRKLRQIGDEFSRGHPLRRQQNRRRHVVFEADRLLPIPTEPIVLLCISLLLFVIARKIYLHGSADGQHRPQA